MSDLTALSQEYAESACFAEEVNADLLEVKRMLMGPSGDSEQGRASRRRLARAVRSVVAALHSAAAREEASDDLDYVPPEVLERIEQRHRPRLAYFIDDLRAATDALDGDESIAPEVLALCDELCEVADATASASFRRLRRR